MVLGEFEREAHVDRVDALTETTQHGARRFRRFVRRAEDESVTFRLAERDGHRVTRGERHRRVDEIGEGAEAAGVVDEDVDCGVLYGCVYHRGESGEAAPGDNRRQVPPVTTA